MDKATAEKIEWALQYADDRNQSSISGHVASNILANEVRRLRALTTPSEATAKTNFKHEFLEMTPSRPVKLSEWLGLALTRYALGGVSIGQVVHAWMNHPPLLPATPPAKPQGGAREWWITKLKPSGMITRISTEKPSEFILGKVHEEFEAIHVREVQTTEAARVPPESHIMQAARLATMLPTSEEADNAASEVISQFEKGSGKPLPISGAICKHNRMTCYECMRLKQSVVPDVTSKPDDPLHNAKDQLRALMDGLQIEAQEILMTHPPETFLEIGRFIAIKAGGTAGINAVNAITDAIIKDAQITPQPNDRLLEAAKAVLDWYDVVGVLSKSVPIFKALRETIEETQGKDRA